MKVGSLVECIDYFEPDTIKAPIKGNIYTVRDIIQGTLYPEYTFIRLEEIVNVPEMWYGKSMEPCFLINAFREVQPPLKITIEELLEEPVCV